MSVPDWTRTATEPTDAELERMHGLPPALRDLVADSTEPLDEEVRALRTWEPQTRRVGWALPATTMVAIAALLLVFGLWQRPEERSWRTGGAATYTVESAGPHTRVNQPSGLTVWEVDPVRPSGTFTVDAGDVSVTVLGTVFIVDHQPPEVTVEVREGRVQVDHPWGRTVLSAGERWVRSAEAEGNAVVQVPPSVEPTRDIAVVRPDVDPRPEAPQPIVAPDPDADPIEPPPEAPDSAPPAADPEDFAALLVRLETGERSAGLIEALNAFGAATTGPLADEAESLAMVVGADVWPPDAAQLALKTWLDDHRGSPHRARLLEAHATVARARLKRCDLALPSYEALSREARGAARARAYAWLGLCAQSLGDETTAQDAFDAALAHGVTGHLREEVELARIPR